MDLLRDYIYFYLFIYFFFCIFPLSPDDDGKSRTLCYALFLFFFFYFFAEIFISNSTNSVCKGKKTTPFFYERGGGGIITLWRGPCRQKHLHPDISPLRLFFAWIFCLKKKIGWNVLGCFFFKENVSLIRLFQLTHLLFTCYPISD